MFLKLVENPKPKIFKNMNPWEWSFCRLKEWNSAEDILKFWAENYDEDLEMKNILFKRILLSKELVFKKPELKVDQTNG